MAKLYESFARYLFNNSMTSSGAKLRASHKRRQSGWNRTQAAVTAAAPSRNMSAAPLLETLETREMMSVSTNAGGWTVVTPAADSHVIYVSSSGGKDSNTGLSAQSPVKTLAHAAGMVRDGSADQLLLKRGDTWHETLGMWTKSGRSASEPLVIGAYGTGQRPTLATGTSSGILLGSQSHQEVDHLVIQGIHFWADGRDPSQPGYNKNTGPDGIQVISRTDGLLIEDCQVNEYEANIAMVEYFGPMKNITVRRSVVTDAYSGNADHAEGLFIDGAANVTLEQNVFDHNGWNSNVPGAVPTVFNHNVYLTGTTCNVIVRGNVFANASSHGLQARSGGIVEDNLFLNNPIGLSYGLVNGAGHVTKGGVTGDVKDNVFIGSRDINGQPRGIGMEIANTKVGGGTVVSGNIFSQYAGGMFPAISLTRGVGTYASDQAGLNDLTIQNNTVYDWSTGISVDPSLSTKASGPLGMKNVLLKDNNFIQTNTDVYNPSGLVIVPSGRSLQAGAPALNRDVAAYNATLGGTKATWAYLASARQVSEQNWQQQYTAVAAVNYIRGGFGLAPVGGMPSPTPTPAPAPKVKPSPTPTPSPTYSPSASPASLRPMFAPVRKYTRLSPGPMINRIKLQRPEQGAQHLTVHFTDDVGASLSAGDLTLSGPDGQIDASNFQLQYDARTHTAVWTFPGLSKGELPPGRYQIAISGANITDDSGRHLDGDGNSIGGDDYTSDKVSHRRRAA